MLDRLGRCDTGLRCKGAGEMPGAHRRAVGEPLDRQRFSQPFARPAQQFAKAPVRPPQFEQGREL